MSRAAQDFDLTMGTVRSYEATEQIRPLTEDESAHRDYCLQAATDIFITGAVQPATRQA